MTVSVRSLLELEDAHLVCVAGERGLDNPVRWVHVSEMLDPTPWMKGSEFLLTTGFRMNDVAAIESYLEHVSASGVSGIGFSTGNYLGMHEYVPTALLEGAEARGLPVLEVPIDTPWLLISEYVSRQVAEEQHQLSQRAFDAQRQLTRAALDPGGGAQVVQLLASLVGGWTVVTTPLGRVIDASPGGAGGRVDDLDSDLTRVRETGSVASVIGSDGGARSLHPLGAPGTVRRILIVGKSSGFDAFDRIVTASAVSLLSFESEQRMRLSSQRQAAAGVLGSAMLDPSSSPLLTQQAAAGLGLDPSQPLRVARLRVPADSGSVVAQLVHDVFSAREATSITIDDVDAQATHTLVAQATGDVEADLRQLASRLDKGTKLGFSAPVLLTDVSLGRRQAAIALAHVLRAANDAASFEELSSYQMIMGLARPEDVDGLARTILAPLDELDRGGGDYADTLRAFLAHNGRWEEAARELGVHRQTLVKRIAATEERLGVTLRSADSRMALWFALQARATQQHTPTSVDVQKGDR